MPFGIGVTEMVILLIVLLVFFGPKRLPEMGRSLGKGMREFKDAITGSENDEPAHKRLSSELPPADADAHERVDAEARERDTVS